MAGASPAEDEYDLNLPEADGQSNDPNQQSAEGSSAPTAPTEPSSSASEDGDAQGTAAGGGSGGNDGGQGGGGTGGDKSPTEQRDLPFASSADQQTVPDLAADRSDGGGVSMPLILLAVAAAACAGIAFWRLRSKDDSDDHSHEAGTRPPGDVARGTQSS